MMLVFYLSLSFAASVLLQQVAAFGSDTLTVKFELTCASVEGGSSPTFVLMPVAYDQENQVRRQFARLMFSQSEH